MNKNIKLIIALIILIIVYVTLRTLNLSRPIPADVGTPTTTSSKDAMVAYSNPTHGISFEYPSSLHLTENEFGATSSPQASIVLIKEADLRDINAGINIPREGPTSITMEIYDNPLKLSASQFTAEHANLNLNPTATTSVTLAGEDGVMYDWSGLYAGRSVVITKGSKAFVFSVTWMSQEDQLVKDFVIILNTLSVI